MRANPAVRKELVKRLGNITKQALSGRVARLKQVLPMTTADAVYVLAHRERIDIGRHLDSESLARVTDLVSRLGSGSPKKNDTNPARAEKRPPARVVRITIAGVDLEELHGLTERH